MQSVQVAVVPEVWERGPYFPVAQAVPAHTDAEVAPVEAECFPERHDTQATCPTTG